MPWLAVSGTGSPSPKEMLILERHHWRRQKAMKAKAMKAMQSTLTKPTEWGPWGPMVTLAMASRRKAPGLEARPGGEPSPGG